MSKCSVCYIDICSFDRRYTCPECRKTFHTNFNGCSCFEEHLFQCSKCKKMVCPSFRTNRVDLCKNCSK